VAGPGTGSTRPDQGQHVTADQHTPQPPAAAFLASSVFGDPEVRARILGAVLTSAGNAIVVADRDGAIQWANPAFTRLNGDSLRDVRGEALRPLASSVIQDPPEATWSAVLRGDERIDEQLFTDGQGERRHVRRTFRPLPDDSGVVTHVIVAYEDLSARPVVEDDHGLFLSTVNAVVLFDDEGRCLDANPAAQELTGYSVEDMLSATISSPIVEADRPRFDAACSELFEGGQAQGRYVMQRRTGELIDIEFQAVAHVRPGVHLATVRDVTAELRTQAELGFQAKVLDSAGEAIIVTDTEGRVGYWNAQAERLYGWRAEEVLGRDILDVTPVQSAIPRGREVRDLLGRGEIWSGELNVRNRDGRVFPVWTTSTPLVDDQGRLTGVIGVSRDISDLRRAQEQVQRRVGQQEVVAELGQELLDVRDLELVLSRACEVLTEVLDVEFAKVLELTDEGRWLSLRAGAGWASGVVGREKVSTDADTQAGYTLRSDEPVVVTDFGEERRFAAPALLVDHGVASGISVVIACEQRTFGVLGVHSRRARAFTHDDAIFVRNIANLIGAAVDRHEATVELERLALFDPLTGLANRTLLLDRLDRLLDHVRSGSGCVSVLLADLDGLKLINDALGRLAGDELLVEVARRVTSLAPQGATVARVGDDEFVLVVEHEVADAALAGSRSLELARRIEAAIADHYELHGREVFVTAYLGIAVQADGDDAQALLRKADAASRTAKQRPQDRAAMYEPDVHGEVGRELELINELRHALVGDEFLVAYQPEVDLRTGRLFGLEALVRWNHPTRGILPPAAFLDTADRIGLLDPIGRRVLREACLHAAGVRRRFPELADLALAVNVAADQLVEPGFVGYVQTVLDQSGLPAEALFLEITESAIIEDHDRTLASLEQVRELGVQIALDDFGTGFSSLTHLHRFPIDLLKIDRHFIDRLLEGGTARTIVEATIGLARTLGLRCVAEGVETAEHLAALDELGCEIGQGYLWSRPLLPADLDDWLQGLFSAAD
jgi:diguanylate cyclase (GGDEF)-like protein/PAS domain S-box-containing protein